MEAPRPHSMVESTSSDQLSSIVIWWSVCGQSRPAPDFCCDITGRRRRSHPPFICSIASRASRGRPGRRRAAEKR